MKPDFGGNNPLQVVHFREEEKHMNQIHEIQPQKSPKLVKAWKVGTRVLGVAESFQKTDERSIVAGVVMRGDLRIDGAGFCYPKVGGTDATDELVLMFNRIDRMDIRAWLLGGSIISWFNFVDLDRLSTLTGVPVVCVSYNPSDGIDGYIKEYFPEDWKSRLEILNRIGERKLVPLSDGFSVYLSVSGVDIQRALKLVDMFTLDGRVPEPIRVARVLSAALRRSRIRKTMD
ncbi:MAG: endonuclease dU [Candidatus Thorarchaeota archaeon]